MKKVLITGGTGYLGSHLVTMLVESNFDVTVLVRPSSSTHRIEKYLHRVSVVNLGESNLDALFGASSFEIILHSATNYGRANSSTVDILNANLVFPLALLELALKWKVPYFVNVDTALPKFINNYSLSKNQLKDWLKQYSDKIHCLNLVLQHFYGPGDDESKFITHIITKLVNNESYLELTLGEQRRDFLYISDVVNAVRIILNNLPLKNTGYDEIEVGSGAPITIREIVLLIAGLVKDHSTDLQFGRLPYRLHEPMTSIANVERLQQLGWIAQIPLDVGLQNTIDYVLNSKISK